MDTPAYMLVDAARHHLIHPKIVQSGRRDTCLHESSCAPDIEEVGAHLIELEQGDALSEWLIEQAPDKSWGIFIRSGSDNEYVKSQLRELLQAELPDGRVVWFRYYDPRVLMPFLGGCGSVELKMIFDQIEQIVVAEEGQVQVLSYSSDHGDLIRYVVGPDLVA